MAVLTLEPPKPSIYSLFTFGDSYTTTFFNTSDVQPSPSNPMGNPQLGHGTAADGINWVGYLATEYNKTLVLNYNLAVYGATVNNTIVSNEPEDLVYQVSRNFYPHYGCASFASSQEWTPDTSLFAIWIGINDIQFSYLDSDPYEKTPLVLESYFRLLHELYQCGARRFLLLNVPPASRTPKMLSRDPWHRYAHRKVVHEFNRQLQGAVSKWSIEHDDTSMALYDTWSFMTDILDNPREYGFADNSCIGEGCIWWDGYHPRSAFHRLLAADIQRNIKLGF
ncbi:GDSL lipase/esterase [Penicillium fimorum]|uniref:GDSL lipase/esterase n=1 Tax=Penicillium fimorum TaxID=1882269 RepID=A0A9W9Y3Z6_9EURO|nr:GDSL lipase/esterase [Penicillium fimorum]